MPIRMSGLSSGLDTESIVSELMSAQRTKLTKIENKQTKLEWKQEKWKDLNKKLYSLYTDKLAKLRLKGTYMAKKTTSSKESVVKASGSATAVSGTHMLQVKQLANAQQITGGVLEDVDGKKVSTDTKLTSLGYTAGQEITLQYGENEDGTPKMHTFAIDEDSTMSSFLSFVKEAGLNANLDTNQNRLYLSAKTSGADHKFEFSMNNQNGEAGLEKLGLDEDSATKVEASDAVFKYNGVEYTQSSNSTTINGMTLQLTGTTANYGTDQAETITITVDTDVDTVYKSIKDFLTSYNEVLKEMNEAYSAESARGYEPLTDEQRDVMTDDQIEKWEKKIKDSLLKRDSTLDSIITGIKGALSGSVPVGDKNYSLSSFGITTSSDYTEQGLLHLYGDTEDSTYASKDDKLREALTNNLDDTVEALSKLFGNLYDKMTKQMASSSISSALTFYNDKQMSELERQYKSEYSAMETRLNEMEDRYYKQFSAMESAMEKLNSQQSQLAGLLGING